MASLVYVDVMVADRRRAWLLVPAGAFIAFAMNILRVGVIVLIPDQDLAADHSFQGIVAIVATVLVVAGVDRASSRLLGEPVARPLLPAKRSDGSSSPWAPRWIGLLCVSAIGASTTLWVPTWSAPGPRSRPYIQIPYAFEGWNADNLKVDREFMGSVNFDERVYRRYTKDDVAMVLFVALDQRLDARHSLLSPKTALLGSDVEVESRSPLPPEPGWPAGEELQVASIEGPKLIWTRVRGADGFWTELWRSLLSADRGPWRRAEDVIVVTVATPMEGSVEATRQRIRVFLEAAGPRLRFSPVPGGPDPESS